MCIWKAPSHADACAAGMFPEGQHLIMGLNPPFGKDNILADKFVFHMAKFRPRLIVLIVPAGTKVQRHLLLGTQLA